MANRKITELDDADTLSGSDLIPVVSNGATKKATLSAIADLGIFTHLPAGEVQYGARLAYGDNLGWIPESLLPVPEYLPRIDVVSSARGVLEVSASLMGANHGFELSYSSTNSVNTSNILFSPNGKWCSAMPYATVYIWVRACFGWARTEWVAHSEAIIIGS